MFIIPTIHVETVQKVKRITKLEIKIIKMKPTNTSF